MNIVILVIAVTVVPLLLGLLYVTIDMVIHKDKYDDPM